MHQYLEESQARQNGGEGPGARVADAHVGGAELEGPGAAQAHRHGAGPGGAGGTSCL